MHLYAKCLPLTESIGYVMVKIASPAIAPDTKGFYPIDLQSSNDLKYTPYAILSLAVVALHTHFLSLKRLNQMFLYLIVVISFQWAVE